MVKASSSSKSTKVSVQGKNATTSVTVPSKDAIKYTNVQSNSASLFAQQANAYATDAARNANRSKVWAEGSDTEVAELGGEHSSKGWVEQAKNYTKEVQNIQDALLSNTAVSVVYENMVALLELKESKDELLEIRDDVEAAAQTTTEQANRAELYLGKVSQSAEEAQHNANMAAVSASMAYNYLENVTEQTNIATENAEIATVQATNALASEKNAKTSETNALTYSNSANTSATTAKEQANISTEKAQESADYSELSKQWAISDTLVDDTDYSSKHYATVATEKANKAEHYRDQASQHAEEAQHNSNMAAVSAGMASNHLKDATEQANISIANAEISITQANNASKSAENSALSEANAKESENKAKTSETNALNSANIATQQAQIAKEEAAKISTVYKYKGSVATFNNLPTNANVGDVYDTQETGMNYAWNGTEWDELGGTFDVSWGSLKGSISDNTDLQTALNNKANNNEVVHLTNNETITGVKTFNGKVNFLGNGDSNAVYLSENTRINVHGTTRTVLGFATGTYLIGHSNYDTLIRGKGERPYWGTGANISTAKTLALTSDIPDTSKFITMQDVEAKGYLTEHQDISNLATKAELTSGLDTKQDKGDYALKSDVVTYTAGENITIENNVISATVPQNDGEEINVSAPIVLTGSQKPIENISVDDNGREYLNDKAFWASISELVPSIAGEDRNENLNFEDLMNTADRAELRFRKLKGFNGVYPQVNLEGYNSIKRVFSVGDIVMADKVNNTVQMCFGKLDGDDTFTPRLICRLQGSSSDFYKFSKVMYLYEPTYTTLNTSSGAWDGNYYVEYGDGSFKTISYKRQNELGGIENIYGIKFIEKDGAYSVAWVNNLGEIIELADSATFDTLDFNLVVFNNYTLELPRADVGIYGFDSTKYFVAKDTVDNVVQRLTDGEAKSISLKYNTDDFIVEEEALRINPDKLPTMPIGAIVPVNASTNYVPNGYLPCDGAEYTKAQFNDLWNNYLTGGELETISTFVPIEGITKNGKSYVFDCTTLSNDDNLTIVFGFTTGNDVNSEQVLFLLDGQPVVLRDGEITYEGTWDSNQDIISNIYVSPNTGYRIEYSGASGGLAFKIDDNYLWESGSVYSISSLVAGSDTFKGSFDLSVGFYSSKITLYQEMPLGETITETKMKSFLNTCDYSEYEADLTTYGQCAKFAVDVDNETFRVPLIINKIVNNLNKADVLYDMTTINNMRMRIPLVDSLGRLNMLFNGTASSDNTEGLTGKNDSDNFGAVKYTGTSYKTSDLPSGGTTSSVSPSLVNLDPNGTLYIDGKDLEQSINIKYFVVVANGQTNQSMMDWSAWASSLQSKASIDLGNVIASQSFINNCISWNTPDYSAGIDVTFPLQATPFVAPCDGVYVVEAYKNNAQSYIMVNEVQTYYYYDRSDSVLQVPFYVYLLKGDIVYWTASLSANFSKFYPYRGANHD